MADASRVRAGFALPATIIALVLLSALVAGALFISTEELRSGRSDASDQRALATAEWALDRAVLAWNSERNVRAVVGSSGVVAVDRVAPNDTVVVTATRVQREAVWITAAATSRGDGRSIPARHTIGASLRLIGASIPMRAALTALGGVTIDGGVVDGRDASATRDPTGWCPNNQPAAGISVPDVSRVTCAGCDSSAGSGVYGAPPVDSGAVVDSSFARFGDETAATLAARASISVAGGNILPRPSTTVSGECDHTDALNWGDPSSASPCADWFPVIHARGSVVLEAGSVGQGILIVDGQLRVESNARFVGVAVVSGDVVVTGAGAEIIGAVFAADVNGSGASAVSDGGAIRFASCTVRRAVLGTARLTRTPVRWWVELR